MEAPSTSTALRNKVDDSCNSDHHNRNRSIDSVNINVDNKHRRNRSLDIESHSIDGNNSNDGGGGSAEQGTVNGAGAGAGRSGAEERNMFEYFGWVYHVGVNSIGHEYRHLRFLFIRGRYIHMYKRDPHEHPGIKPIRKGVIGPALMVEERGRQNINNRDLYVLRFYNRSDQSQKGEIACATAGEARRWMEAFDHAKQQVEYELSNGGSTRDKLSVETEINLDGHRPRVRRYAHGLRRLIRIGQGPETLLRQRSNLATDLGFDEDGADAIEPHEWRCVRTINGVRILEDVSSQKSGKGVLVKSVGVIDAVADTVFEVLMNLEKQQRYEWDMLTADLELIDSYDGHYDVVYGTYDPKYLTRWNSKRDFVFSRQWFRGQDGTYTILQFPATHKKKPPRSGYRRSKITPSTWEIKNLNSPMGSSCPRCLVTHTVEINTDGWGRWKNNASSKFEKSIPYALLCQVSGLKEYLGANPALNHESVTTISGSVPLSIPEYDSDVQDEFYDAIAAESSSPSSSDEDNDEGGNDDGKVDKKVAKHRLKNVSLAIRGLGLKKAKAIDTHEELDPRVTPITLDFSQAYGALHKGKDENDTNCWSSPSGTGFMIRGKSYLKDNSKVVGGDPLLKLVAADWFKVDEAVDGIALNHNCLVQSDEGKKLPFIVVVNLQVPAKPNYSLVLYYAADRPIIKDSLLSKFVDGTDMFRDSRLKLIPSIVEGYWMVKRAVGTKACLLGKALTCRYLRQDNFLEIDVDIGSSSVARSVIGLVMGYVTSIVVDLAILIEGKEEAELPEYILGTVRLNRIRLDSAVPL